MNHLSVEQREHVGLIVFDRPPNNFISVELIADIAAALEEFDTRRDCRTVVLASEGKVFSAGADFSNGSQRGGASGDTASYVEQLYREAERLFKTRKPIVAAVQGPAVGAGLGLALVADFRVAAPEARFVANFAKLGFHCGFGISLTLPRAIGLQAANLILQTGRRVTGEEALAMGLVDQLEPLASVRHAAVALAAEIAANAPLPVEAMRATLRIGLVEEFRVRIAHELAQQIQHCATADFAEGVRAVAERRPGRFVGG
jgi:enoyl-CoA hydratase/carnithine racemase